jgi:HEAT repeat protein
MRRSLSLVILVFLAAAGCANRSRQSVALYEAGDYAAAARAAEAGLATHPGDHGLWQMRVRAALALGDAEGVARSYASYRGRAGGDDGELLMDLAVATLGQALASPSARLKIAAIDAVAAAELQVLADHVAERLGDDDDRVAAAAAAAVLRGYPQAPQVASQMLRSDDPEARRIAVDGVGKKVGALAIADLQQLAGSDPDPRVRRAAIRWIGQLKHAGSAELLERQLRHADESVRAAAALALARIATGDLARLAHQALADRALAVRLAGVELLSVAGRHAELAELATDRDPMVALEAAIASRRPELARQALDRAATDDSWTARAAAANLATRALGNDATAFATQLLGDPEPRVRLAAARVVSRKADRAAAIAVLVELLAGDARLAAATDLAELGDSRGTDILDQRVRDLEAAPDQRAAAAAAHRSARTVTPGLVAALADPSAIVRVAAATALVMLARGV